MKVIACDVEWTFSGGVPSCPGTLHTIQADQIPTGITLEDASILKDHGLELLAIAFGFLVLKKALK
ncbi:MAG: hypothetical protein CVV09_05005 [Gammaproteobacteria bacterium HGW-Gammaproteobacteria-13]|nr:MAG: hypothetical protein CVV09_05005 [Gammaproteobacteria bacterium HGW-Gammaproteobacteria-13]